MTNSWLVKNDFDHTNTQNTIADLLDSILQAYHGRIHLGIYLPVVFLFAYSFLFYIIFSVYSLSL